MPSDSYGNYIVNSGDVDISNVMTQRGLGRKGRSSKQPQQPRVTSNFNPYREPSYMTTVGQYYPQGVSNKYSQRIGDVTKYETQEDVEQALADVQTGAEAIGNALLGNVITAGTTFASNIATVISSLFSPLNGDGREGGSDEVASIYNNRVQRAILGLQRGLESSLPIYSGSDYADASTWERMGTSKFWAEFIKNAGFTEGNMLANMLYSAIPYVGPFIATIAGPLGEASTEAFNSRTDKVNTEVAALNDRFNKERDRILQIPNLEERNQALQELSTQYSKDIATINRDADRAGNIVFGTNVALLALTNFLEFGSLIKNFSKGAEKAATKRFYQTLAEKTALGRGLDTAEDLTKQEQRALMRQATKYGKEVAERRGLIDLVEEGGKTQLKANTGREIARATGRWAAHGLEEAFEEGSQDVFQKIPYYLDNVNNYAATVFDDQARTLATDTMGAITKAFSEVMHDKDTYTDMLMGFLTGAIGTPGLKGFTNNQTGRRQLPLSWNGGIAELVGDYQQVAERNKIVNDVNNTLFKDNKFNTYYNGLVRNIAINNVLEGAILDGNTKAAKDAESAEMFNHIRTLDKIGMGDHIKDIANGIANMDDAQLTAFLNDLDDNSPLKTITLEEARTEIKKAAEKVSDDVDYVRNTRNELENTYGSEMTEAVEDNLLYARFQARNALTRMGEMTSDLYDIYKRRAEVEGETVISEKDFVKLISDKGETVAEKDTAEHVKELITDGKDFETDGNNNKKMLEDLPKVQESFNYFTKYYTDTVKDLKEANKKEAERELKAADNNKKAATNREIDKIGNIQEANAYIENNRNNPSAMSQLQESTNPYVKKALDIDKRVSYVYRNLPEDITQEERDDVTALLNNYVGTATEDSKLDTINAAFQDPDILPQREGDTLDSREARLDRANEIIQGIVDNFESSSKDTPAEDVTLDPVMELDTSTGTGSSNVGEVPAANSTEPVEITDKGQGVIAVRDNSAGTAITVDSGNGVHSEDSTADSEEPDNQQSQAEGNPTEIVPSHQEFTRESMRAHKGGENTFAEHTNPIAQLIVGYLRAQKRGDGSTFNAFDYINSGKLEEYRKAGGEVYFGIDPTIKDEDGNYIILQLIKIEGEYFAIGTNYKSGVTVDGINKEVRNSYNEASLVNGKYVHPTLKTTIKEVKSGRVRLLNKLTALHTAIKNTMQRLGGKKFDAHIVINNSVQSGAPKGMRGIPNASSKGGSAYIAIPNAKGGYNPIAIVNNVIPNFDSLSEKAAQGNKYAASVISAVQGIVEAAKLGDRNALVESVNELAKWISIRNLDVILTKDEEPKLIVRQVEMNSDGTFRLRENGRRRTNKGRRREYNVSTADDNTVKDIINGLNSWGNRTRISKDFAGTEHFNMIEAMSEAGALSTHCDDLRIQAAWYTLNAITEEAKAETEVTAKEQNKEIKPEDPTKKSAASRLRERQAKRGTVKAEKKEAEPNVPVDVLDSNAYSRKNELEKKTKESRERVFKNLKTILPQLSDADRLIIVNNLTDPKGSPLNGAILLAKAVIVLDSDRATGTEYHEAFHYVFRLILDEKSRKAVLKEARLQYGKKYSDKELEELLADSFRDYMNKESTLLARIKNFFKKLKYIISRKKEIINNTQSLFKSIESGKYAAQEIITTSEGIANSYVSNMEVRDAWQAYQDTIMRLEQKSKKGDFRTYGQAVAMVRKLTDLFGIDKIFRIEMPLKDEIRIVQPKKMNYKTFALKYEEARTKYMEEIREINEFEKEERKQRLAAMLPSETEIETLQRMGISDDMMETITPEEVLYLLDVGHSRYFIETATIEERKYAKGC